MATHILHISDAGKGDYRVPVTVAGQITLAAAVQEALEDFEAEHRGDIEFPLFIDIHSADEFAAVDWTY